VVFRDIENFNELVYSLLRTRDMAARLTPEFMNSSNDADIVAESSAMKEVIHRAFKVAGVDSSVLLTGETGVGKEVVAKIIHKHSRRAGSSFVKINCGAIPGELLESELFGYEPGSFTGARPGGKPGLIELANRGTLFLDEIAELPFKLQSKLLRVIQEREIMRIGSTGTKKVDFRLIAATNKNLRDLTSGKVFREDLFYRINVVPIHIPPLRERKEDIVPFVAYFLHIFNTKYRLHKRITPVVIQKFLEYDWPGNVRELQNVVERLLVTSSSNLIMDGEIFKPSYPGKLPDKALPKLRKVLEKTEKEFILGVVQRYKTTREMAEAMGISQSAVVKKMHKYGIERTTFYLEP
jgi:transcriptional regulator with PAS, ATPase and Fis domain